LQTTIFASDTSKLGCRSDNIDDLAGMKFGHRDNNRFERIGIARHNPLQSRDDVCADENWVDCQVRHGRMATSAFDRDVDFIHRRHYGAEPDRVPWLVRREPPGVARRESP
jgi:hypothetical protein